MATGKNGTFIINNTASSGLPMGACRFTWEETYDVSTNTSVVKITKMEMLCAGDGLTQDRNYGLGPLWFNGDPNDAYTAVKINETVVATVSQRNNNFVLSNPVYGAYADVTIVAPALPWQTTVAHNSDGTKSVTVTVWLHALASSGNALTNTKISGSATLELTTIPRASTVTAPNGDIGSAVAITINRASSSFTHTLTYKFGSATGTIATKTTAASVSWTPPTSLYAQVPSATSGSCTITCDTYNGSTKIGTTTKNITLSVPASVKPTVQSGWATVSRENGSVSVAEYIQGYSKAKVTFDPSKVTAGSGSSVKSFTITYAGKTYTASNNVAATPVFTASGQQTITATVTDQRGRTASANLTVNVQPYSVPTLSAIRVYRCDSDRTASDMGIYFYADATASCASVNGKNAITERKVRYKTAAGAYGAKADFPGRFGQILTTATYVVEISAKDTVGNKVTATVTLPTATVGMNLRKNHDGVAFGKYSEHEKALELPEDWHILIGDRQMSAVDSYTVTAKTHTNFNDTATRSKVPTMQFLAYWNGAYNANNASNLTYCSKGAFGALATKDSLTAADVGARPSTWTPTAANVGAVSGKVVWTNASPTSSFAAQTVSLTLTGYQLVCVLFHRNNNAIQTSASSTNSIISAFATASLSAMVNYKEGDYTSRLFSWTTSGVKFLAGNLNGASNNNVMIPYKIIAFGGIK